TYTANLTAASGCDSIATLVLTVSPTLTSTTNTAICTNQLPYTWNGQTINAAGTYTANLTSVSGCDSIATLVLTVSPTLTSTTNTAICTNQLPYTWNGQVINAAGTYTASLTAASGCDSIATLVLTVSPTLTSTTNTAICTNQLPYTWNGQTINAAGTYTANLTSVSGCDSIATLVLAVSPTLTSTTNTAICTNQLPYTWNGQAISAAGTYTANLTAASGCDSIATLVLIVSPTLTSTTNTAICTNQLPYTWNGQVINAAGTYTASLTAASGCDSIATLVLTVSPTLTSTTNTAICTNQLPYTWNGQTINAAGTYTANLTSVSGCDSIATLVLAVSPTLTSTTNTAICTNQLPYTWNGQAISAAGTYTANLTAASGCDSIATLVLTVSPTLTSTTNTAICTNQLPYTWNGQTINAAGTYTANLIAASGCDSIATLNLTVNPAVSSTTNTAICTNQLPYTWNGQTINVAGTYTANLIAASGCDSIATLVLTVSPAVTSTTNTAICTNQLPYTWNGQTINTAGIYTANLTSVSGCDSIATLVLTVSPILTSTTNTAICTNQLPYTWNGQTINAAGTYTANLTAASGCDSIATLVLTVSPTLTSTTNTAICTNQLPYTWNGQTINAAGTYTANLTAASGCDSIATLVLTVNPTLTTTTNTAICTNQLPYTWNGQAINAAGTYTANLTSVSGCDSIATLILTVSPTLTSTTNTAICTNQLPYTWNGQTINAAGTYTANLTSVSGCDSIATLVLTVSPTLTSTTNTAICTNQLPYTWNGQAISAAGTYTANLTAASGCDSIATLVLTVSSTVNSTTNLAICTNQLPYTWNGQTINAAGTYTANLTAASGCDSIATLVLAVSPTLTSTTNTAICTNQLPYTWNGQTINAAGTYTANLTSVSGCDSIATLVLTVSPTLTSTTNTAICTNQLPYTWNGQAINAAGTYTANLTAASGCDSIATLVLAVSPTLTSTTNTAICTNQLPYTWNGQAISAAGTYTANLTAASGCDSIATLVLIVSPTLTSTTNTAICTNQLPYTWNGQVINAAGTYTASLTAASGCDSIATLVLTVSPAVTSTTNTAICTNQLPYTWNGQTINAAGTYTANLIAASGCDSIATLNLTVNSAVTSTTNTAICTNQLPYTWNGQTINAAGTYVANLTSISGCDSIATLNLTVNPAVTSTTNTAICTNQLPYTWNGQTINAAGTYTANLTAASGCDSIATLVLAVSPMITSTTNTAICTNQLPYTWNGQTINAAGTYTANLTSVSGCDSIATLVLTVSPTLTSTTNTAICTNQLPYTWNGQTINAAGTYTANLTAASGCDSIATLVLTVNPTLTSTTNTAICTNQLPYTWNGQTINAAGTYTANLTSVSGCDSVATLVLAVSPTLTSTTNTAICTNQLPYTWNAQTINAAGSYTANLTSISGCDSIATLVLTVSPTLTSTTNAAICTNQLPYTWNGQTINAAGTYTANLTNVSGCDSIATLVLTVSPTLTSTTNTAICTNQLPYTWNGQAISAAGTYTANLTAASGCDSIATLVLTVSPTLTSTTNTAICTNQLPYTWNGQTINAAGTYTANLTSVSGCDSIATLNLIVNPAVSSTTNTTICTNQLPYTWNGQTINAAGTYTANLTSVSGCDSIATLVLTVSPSVTSTTNTAICTNQLPYTWNGQTINAAGTYTANLTGVSGCDSIATLNLTVNPAVTSTTNTAICTNQLPYTWNGQAINAAGTYTANLTAASGCDSIATLVLTVSPTLTSTTNTAICTNQLPYTWNGQTINAAGTYTANLTSVSGCD
ncbi:beta strand repeat-containing protein, partial [Niastella sp. OAS944]